MPATPSRLSSFIGGETGAWRVLGTETIVGDPIPEAPRVDVVSGAAARGAAARDPREVSWILRGITSNERYVVRDEKAALLAKQPGLGRPESIRAALIPIRKNADWWALSQDERRSVFEEQSHHIQIGLRHLPAVARRLHHCRDLGETEPFDFLTWFEFAPSDEAAFNDLLVELRASREWTYVCREVDIRLVREGA